jgi:hypothetical protein
VPGKGEIMGRWMKKIKNKQFGQAMAEFALTLPIFLLLVFGVIELSRFFLIYSSVYTASREAARYGSSVGEIGSQNYLNCSEVINRAVTMGNFGGVQTDDVTVYYEKSPTSPEADQVVCDGIYEPELGDRLVVEIVTEFDSLLGIVPDIPIRAINGRTIMMNIVIERTPEPIVFDKCGDYVSYVSTDLEKDDANTKLKIQIQNTSTKSTYTIYSIDEITWSESPKLVEVRWIYEDPEDAETIYTIWKKPELSDGATSPVSLPTDPVEGEIDYWNLYLRNLYTESTGTLEFIFDNDLDDDTIPDVGDLSTINLTFKVVMHNTNIFADKCNLVK